MNDLKRPGAALALLIVLFLVISTVFRQHPADPAVISLDRIEHNSMNLPPIPPLTPDTIEALKKSHGFQVLASYTDGGFAPVSITINRGETVRFTNNSSDGLWVSAVGDSRSKAYPGTPNGCGQSHFDSCRIIGRGEFWEFTFDVVGEWKYQNNLDKSKTAVIYVK